MWISVFISETLLNLYLATEIHKAFVCILFLINNGTEAKEHWQCPDTPDCWGRGVLDSTVSLLIIDVLLQAQHHLPIPVPSLQYF